MGGVDVVSPIAGPGPHKDPGVYPSAQVGGSGIDESGGVAWAEHVVAGDGDGDRTDPGVSGDLRALDLLGLHVVRE